MVLVEFEVQALEGSNQRLLKGNFAIFYMLAKYVPDDIK